MAVNPVSITINATVTGQQSIKALSQALEKLGVSANSLSASSLGATLLAIGHNAATASIAMRGLALPVASLANSGAAAGVRTIATAIAGIGTSAGHATTQVHGLTQSLHQAGTASQGLTNISVGAQGAGFSLAGLATRVGGIAIAFKLVKEAAEAAYEFVKAGINANAEEESSRLGIASLVASLTTVKNAQGEVLHGADALNASYGIADEQLKKLRIAGIETAATYQQLKSAYQEAIGAGSAAGLNLSQVRELTIGITQAAGALNIPMFQINQEIRAILAGQIDQNARVGQALHLSKEELDLWKKKGVLFDELSKKLEIYRIAGAQSATTWKAALSNAEDAFQILAGESTQGMFQALKGGLNDALKGLFDLKDASIDKALQPLVSELDQVNAAIGQELAGAIRGIVDGIKEFSGWIHANQSEVDGLTGSLGATWDVLKQLGSMLGDVLEYMGGAVVKSGVLETILRSVAVVGALLVDSVQLLGAAFVSAGGFIVSALAVPLAKVYGLVKGILNLIPGSAPLGDRLIGDADNLKRLQEAGARSQRAFTDLLHEKTTGNSSVDRIIQRFNTQITTAPGRPSTPHGAVGATSTANPVADDRGKKGGGRGSRLSADADFKADLAAERTELEANYAVLKAGLEKSLEERHASRKEAIQEETKQELDHLEAQKAILEKEKKNAEAALIKPGVTPAEHQRLANDLKKINASITATLDKEAVVKIKAEIDQEKLAESITKLRASLSGELFSLSGDSLNANLTRIREELRQALNDPTVQSDQGLIDQVNERARLKEQAAAYSEKKRIADETSSYLSLKESDLQRQADQGFLTEQEHAVELKKVRTEAAEAIKKQADAMRELAGTNPELKLQVAQLDEQYKKLTSSVSEFGKALGDSVSRGFQDGIKSLHEGKGVGDVLKSLLLTVATDIESNEAKKIGDAISKGIQSALGADTSSLTDMVSNLFKKIFSGLGGGGGGGGIGGFVSNLFGGSGGGGFDWASMLSFAGFAEGGIVSGPGTETSDSIPAWLSDGEAVLNAKATRRLGHQAIHALNAGAQRLSTGGIVGGANSPSTLPGVGGGAQSRTPQELHVHVDNVLDATAVLQRADSAVMHRFVLDAASAHPTAMRQALGLTH